MGLFFEAATAWYALQNTEYVIHIAKKGKINIIELSFFDCDFPHISGMQYAGDVDFGIRKAEYYGSKLLYAVLNGRMNDEKIEKSKNWNEISGRLKAIVNLRNILENEFTIAFFNKNKVSGYCRIDAEFIIKSEITDDIYFIFLDEKTGKYYCKSAFKKNTKDYFKNQTTATVLYKMKKENGACSILHIKQGYNPK